MDSTSSTRTNAAATPNSVKSAYDLANTANTGLDNKLDKTGDGKDVTATFTEASERANIGTGEKLSVIFGKIKKWHSDLKALAFKDAVSDSDISGTISDNHIASAFMWNGKADKVSGATNGNFAALDANGNLTDSGKKATDFELVTNKVSSWQTTPDNTHYPSEKLVKDALDAKADADNVVAIVDAYVDRFNINTIGWYKIADRQFNDKFANNNSLFDLAANIYDDKFYGKLKICVRSETIGSSPLFKSIAFYSEFGWPANKFPIKFVSRGLVGACTLEVWVGFTGRYRGISLTEVGTSGAEGATYKAWNYYKISTGAGESEPVNDETNHVITVNVPVYQDQHNIDRPTNNNLVAMDENGLVKNGGVAVLPSTSTWDGTSDAKVPTAKAVAQAVDAISKLDGTIIGNGSQADLDDCTSGSESDRVHSYYWVYSQKDNVSHKPTDDAGQMLSMSYNYNNAIQIVITGSGVTYSRSKVAGTWTDWFNIRDASWINGGVFQAAQIPTSLPNVTAGSATTATNYASGGGIANALDGKQDSLTFMDDSEAVAIWADAKTAAANAS